MSGLSHIFWSTQGLCSSRSPPSPFSAHSLSHGVRPSSLTVTVPGGHPTVLEPSLCWSLHGNLVAPSPTASPGFSSGVLTLPHGAKPWHLSHPPPLSRVSYCNWYFTFTSGLSCCQASVVLHDLLNSEASKLPEPVLPEKRIRITKLGFQHEMQPWPPLDHNRFCVLPLIKHTQKIPPQWCWFLLNNSWFLSPSWPESLSQQSKSFVWVILVLSYNWFFSSRWPHPQILNSRYYMNSPDGVLKEHLTSPLKLHEPGLCHVHCLNPSLLSHLGKLLHFGHSTAFPTQILSIVLPQATWSGQSQQHPTPGTNFWLS